MAVTDKLDQSSLNGSAVDDESIRFCALVHAEPKVGKSWLAQTVPEPRLILDAEGGSMYPMRMRKDGSGKAERIKKVNWNPLTDPPPVYDGTWETCHVIVRSYAVMERAYEWLNDGNHPFKSVVMDSLTEVQKRLKDVISGDEATTERQWGQLLTKMETLVRNFRDLKFHPTNPIDVTLILALTVQKNQMSKWRPAVQGALGVSLPGYVDLEGYYGMTRNEDNVIERKLLIEPHPMYEAGDRTHFLTEFYGSVILTPSFEEMYHVLNPQLKESK